MLLRMLKDHRVVIGTASWVAVRMRLIFLLQHHLQTFQLWMSTGTMCGMYMKRPTVRKAEISCSPNSEKPLKTHGHIYTNLTQT